MEFNFPAIATGFVTPLDEETAVWSNATHLLVNPMGMIGLRATGMCMAQLMLAADGRSPVMIAGKYHVADTMQILVEQVMPLPAEQPAAGPEVQTGQLPVLDGDIQ
jgi:hypothetical protein